MKIGILTQHFLRNYGGIIQNYALQQVLLRLGHEPLTMEHDTCFTRWRWLLRYVKALAKGGQKPEPLYRGHIGHRPFIDFIHENIRSVGVHRFSPATHNTNGCEAYVVGSDQVWRPAFNLGERLGNMFLDFVPDGIRKVAYAASFGVDTWEFSPEQTEHCRQLAARFDAVSVREASGIALCRQHLGIEATQVLDPTLLLHKEDYEKVCRNVPKENPFLLVYVLVMTDELQAAVEKAKRQTGLPVKYIFAGDAMQPDDTMEGWLAAFRDAAFVVTDSFHGTVFSLIFQKPFNVLVNKGGGASRLHSLLDMVGLSKRLLEGGDLNMNEIDWATVNEKIEAQREPSMKFLKESLQ